MTILFYILVIACFTIEIATLSDPERAIRASKTIKEKQAEGTLNTLAGYDRNYAYNNTFYTVVALAGLFSSQWILFALLLVIGVIAIPFKYNATFRRVDSVVSAFILLFIILNKYHLHLDLVEWIKTLV